VTAKDDDAETARRMLGAAFVRLEDVNDLSPLSPDRPTAQRTMAKRTGARTVEIASSHAVMLSRPQEVATFIKEAAAQMK
jgi:hypothetical protein